MGKMLIHLITCLTASYELKTNTFKSLWMSLFEWMYSTPLTISLNILWISTVVLCLFIRFLSCIHSVSVPPSQNSIWINKCVMPLKQTEKEQAWLKGQYLILCGIIIKGSFHTFFNILFFSWSLLMFINITDFMLFFHSGP